MNLEEFLLATWEINKKGPVTFLNTYDMWTPMFEMLHNFSDNLSFVVGVFIPDLLTRKLNLMEVQWEAFGSMVNAERIPL